MPDGDGEGRRWDDEVDEEGLPISPGAKRAIKALDKKWGERYVRFARRTNRILLGLGVGVVLALVAQGLVIRENNSDSARQDTAIVAAQRANCVGFDQFRDAVEIIFFRAFAAQDPGAAQALAAHVGLSQAARKSLPTTRSAQARALTEQQRKDTGAFFTVAIVQLDGLHCHVSKRT